MTGEEGGSRRHIPTSGNLPTLSAVEMAHGRVAYREAGAGQAVFLLHGMNGQSGSWQYQFAALAGGVRLIAWDAPGYGGSDVCAASIDELARVGRELLRVLGARTPLLVGHSMGGVIAGRMAINYPDDFAGLVLSCTHSGWGDPPGKPLRSRYADRIRELEALGIERYAALRARRMVDECASPGILRFLGEMSKAITREALETVGRANQEADNRPGLEQLEIPLYVLYAEQDRVIKRARTLELVSALPQAREILLPGVGHAPYVEDPAGYNRVIGQIIQETLGTPGAFRSAAGT